MANPLEMSDDDFLKSTPPEAEDKAQEETLEPTPVVEKAEEPIVEDKPVEEPVAKEELTDAEKAAALEAEDEDKPKDKPVDDKPAEKKPDEPVVDDKAPKTDAVEDTTKVEEKPIDYEAEYKKLLTIRANGKDVTLKDTDEVIRMMQQGAGFAKKMQQLQPHLKTIRLLEKNQLINPERLSFLIDLNNKNPDAIKKLVKESGIDPLDFNTEDNVTYVPTNHTVSDKEMSFATVLEEVGSSPEGKETLRIVNTTWDDNSKKALWDSPQILTLIQEQRDNGIYDLVTAEIDRQKSIGIIPPTTQFLDAYKAAGDSLAKQAGVLKAPTVQQNNDILPNPVNILAVKTAQPKPVVANNDKAKAASSTQATARKAEAVVNPLQMSDEDFLKQFDGRL